MAAAQGSSVAQQRTLSRVGSSLWRRTRRRRWQCCRPQTITKTLGTSLALTLVPRLLHFAVPLGRRAGAGHRCAAAPARAHTAGQRLSSRHRVGC